MLTLTRRLPSIAKRPRSEILGMRGFRGFRSASGLRIVNWGACFDMPAIHFQSARVLILQKATNRDFWWISFNKPAGSRSSVQSLEPHEAKCRTQISMPSHDNRDLPPVLTGSTWSYTVSPKSPDGMTTVGRPYSEQAQSYAAGSFGELPPNESFARTLAWNVTIWNAPLRPTPSTTITSLLK